MNTQSFGFMVSRKPVEEYFGYVERYGINHLEIDLKKKHSLLSTFTDERVERVKKWCEEKDVSLSLHPPFNMNLCSRLWLVRRRHVSYLKQCIGLARRLGAGHLTLHLGNFYRFAAWANPRQHALERLVKVLRKLVPAARSHGVKLALENMIPIPPEAGYTFLGDNIEDFDYIYSRLDSEYAVFCLDIGHANTAEGAPAYVDRLAEKMVSVHFHDNNGQYDEHLDVGKGAVPWQELMARLKEKNFRGPYVSECFNSPPHRGIEQLKKLL
jgi:sugar phosphate isomerase/epimerase